MRLYQYLVIIVLALMTSLLIGCQSEQKALANAATPLAANMAATTTDYANKLDDPAKTAALNKTQVFLTAAQTGARADLVQVWSAPDGFRQMYVGFVSNDPAYQTGTGIQVKSILLNNATAFDYILQVGQTPAK